jgi:prenylcysteine alpha-carboxyl methylesterase
MLLLMVMMMKMMMMMMKRIEMGMEVMKMVKELMTMTMTTLVIKGVIGLRDILTDLLSWAITVMFVATPRMVMGSIRFFLHGGVRTVWNLIKLAWTLYLNIRGGITWVIMLLRLLGFAALLTPAWCRLVPFYFSNKRIIRNVQYGENKRNFLDVYLPSTVDYPIAATAEGTEREKVPVIIFVSGGAWCIGYKGWAALMGKKFMSHPAGVCFISADYRNFPQGTVSDMIEDIDTCVDYVFQHCDEYGGDRNRIYLAGQSAGAHLSALVCLRAAIREHTTAAMASPISSALDLANYQTTTTTKTTTSAPPSPTKVANQSPSTSCVSWQASSLKGFIGISGPYNIRGAARQFIERGLNQNILKHIFEDNLEAFSPTIIVKNYPARIISRLLPPKWYLFHGTADHTLPHSSSVEFADALRKQDIETKIFLYHGKSHTDPIIEDAMLGKDDKLIHDVMKIVLNSDSLVYNYRFSGDRINSESQSAKTSINDIKVSTTTPTTTTTTTRLPSAPANQSFSTSRSRHFKKDADLAHPLIISLARFVNPF